MATLIDLRLFELLNARICHDLVGPVGAISNGVELLTEFGMDDADDVLPLLASSARLAACRLDFYRVAFGFAGGRAAWSPDELRRLAAGLFEDTRATLDWPVEPGTAEIEARAAKLLLVMVMLGGEALPRGGTVHVSPGPPARVVASGPSPSLHEPVRAALAADLPADALEARSAHAAFARLLAASLSTALHAHFEPDRLVLDVEPA